MAANTYADIARLEPTIGEDTADMTLAHTSIAISLKRIADAAERCTSVKGLFDLISTLGPMIEAAESNVAAPKTDAAE
jgi:hypothetical protein